MCESHNFALDGQILGALLGLGGVTAFAGAQSRSANMLNISVVVSIVGLLIAFQFIGEVRHWHRNVLHACR